VLPQILFEISMGGFNGYQAGLDRGDPIAVRRDRVRELSQVTP
jgi:hypothetical protein